jgi:MFS transporter, NNP family, nitrate/nitrite transporter
MKDAQSLNPRGGDSEPAPLISQLGPLLFLVGIFFLNFVSRIILGPLMPAVEEALKVGHEEAGSLFLLISIGYSPALLASGFVSSRLNHRRTITLSSIALGGALLIVGFGRHLWTIRLGLVVMGMAAGLYLPSAIATITEMVCIRDWGKAIAIHELAPNLGLMAAPFLAEALLSWCSWQGVIKLWGLLIIVAGVLSHRFGRGGLSGEAPNFHTFRIILKEPSFWIMMFFFGLGIGAQMGGYSIMPLYLVSEHGMDRPWANTVLGFARMAALVMTLLSGWITDRLGTKQTLRIVLLAIGVMTLMLGMVSGSLVVLFVFLQAMLSTCFFTPWFAAIAQMASPKIKNVAVSITVPLGSLLGAGVIPAVLGAFGEAGSFSTGFLILGGLLIGGFLLVPFLKFPKE